MELFFDTTDEARDVREETEKVVRLAAIDSELHAPPPVTISWGSLLFTGVLSSVNQTFNRFLSDGRPVRARLDVTWSELIDPDRESRETNRQTADFSKRHVVSEGETLSDIATRYYEQPAAWRAIALENGIEDPRRDLFAGREIVVPSLPYLDPDTGEALP
jgi:nucleoid-associated protein YgaU